MKTLSLAILFLSVMTTKCSEDQIVPEITEIKFGTSFGMCFGYCIQEVVFVPGSITKTLTPQRNPKLKEKACSLKFSEFESLVSKIDFAGFSSLEEQIGCPDCADGGAEWIEIISKEGSKRVTYEFGKEPKEVKSIIGELRKYYDSLGECE